MLALSRIYGTLTGRRAVKYKAVRDVKSSFSNDSEDGTDTDDCDGNIAIPHSSRSSKYSKNEIRHDSGTAIRISHAADAAEPFPDIDSQVLATDVFESADPPNLQGLDIDNVDIYLQRLLDDPVFGTRDACAGRGTSRAENDTGEVSVQVLDTSVDLTSASVSRSGSSTVFVNAVENKDASQTNAEKASNALEDASARPFEEPSEIQDPFGARHQLPDEKMEDYVKRVSAKCSATMAKYGRGTRIDTPVSSSASITSSCDEEFDISGEFSFNESTDTCPSSPPTPFAPRTPLNHRNLSKLETPDTTTNETEEDDPQSVEDPTTWTPPPMTGPPIFNLTKTRMTPPRSEVYKHIDLTPLALFHRRSSTRRYVILEQDCLQCRLKNLPCDDYHPSCKRCQRSGDAPYCLRQRRLASWELRQLGLEKVRGYTVLIRLPEDGDDVWAEKLRREEGLLEVLQERVDRENWVFPVDDGVVDGFDEGAVRGREVCEGRGGIWRYRFVDDAELRIVLGRY
ncbi:hypothetical protein FKW77_006306 [Venturia effusa]|uniref:Zn(2)-C6 fungal-type domain-containing protein n=1 Tax=Venturia effusa TaxID=50376 RepID=A0A517L3H0_9PEZI|nr:hypothetical protein FKW77_006306 [Venturia effusa]